MSLRNIIILLLTLVYFIFCYKYFNADFFANCCSVAATNGVKENVTTPIITKEAALPISFAYNSAEPDTTIAFEAIKADLLAASKENDALEIVGYYFEDEEKPDDYDDMGMFRAMQVIELISPPLDQDKIKVISKKVDEPSTAKDENFESLAFNWQTKKEFDAPKITTTSDGDIRILFAENSTKFEESEELEAYFDGLAEKLKGDKTLIAYVVGHTDKTGNASANQRLSESRARKIRRILRNRGVSSRQLKPIGRGMYQSIAPNDNEAGKRLNRRVEIKLDTIDK